MRATGLGQALEGIKVIASLGGGAIVLYVVYEFAVVLELARDEAPGGSGGLVANDWLNTGLDTVLPVALITLAFFGLVSQAILARRFE